MEATCELGPGARQELAMRRAGGKVLHARHSMCKGPEVGRLMWLERQRERNGGEDEVGRWAGPGGQWVLRGGQWGASGRLRAELGRHYRNGASGFPRNGLAPPTAH